MDLAKECSAKHCILHNGRDSVPIPVREWPVDQNRKKTMHLIRKGQLRITGNNDAQS